MARLLPRPPEKSWIKKFELPDAEQDSTGSTSQWKLEWRSEQEGAVSERVLETDETLLLWVGRDVHGEWPPELLSQA